VCRRGLIRTTPQGARVRHTGEIRPDRRARWRISRGSAIVGAVAKLTLSDVQSLLDAPSPAVLTTIRRDGSPLVSPV